MTYQATFHFQEKQFLQQSNILIIQLNATDQTQAHQKAWQRWKQFRKALHPITCINQINLVALDAHKTLCPKCGATELSFCHHQKQEL